MLIRKLSLVMSSLVLFVSAPSLAEKAVEFNEGDTVVALVNLHADPKGNRLFGINYQRPNLIPMCAELTVQEVERKQISFMYQGVTYPFILDKHTRKAGQSLQQSAAHYFGKSCDKAAAAKLGEIDQKGIRVGRPYVGMSKEGVLFAMGRPPFHANRSLESSEWVYWLNRWNRIILKFDENGVLKTIVD